ncbi:MAG: hypothetical protein AB7I23_14545 [Vicinamibacterales bacterium]
MSLTVIAMVFASNLPSGLRLTALACANFAADDGRRVFPAVARLAKMTAKSRSQVVRDLRRLVALGVLVLERRGGGTAASVYAFNLKALTSVVGDTGSTGATGGTGARRGSTDAPGPVAPVPPDPLVDPSRARRSPPTPASGGRVRFTRRELLDAESDLRAFRDAQPRGWMGPAYQRPAGYQEPRRCPHEPQCTERAICLRLFAQARRERIDEALADRRTA